MQINQCKADLHTMKNITQVSHPPDSHDTVLMHSVGHCPVVDQRLTSDPVTQVIVPRKLGLPTVWFPNTKGGDLLPFCLHTVWVIGGVPVYL